MPLVGSVVVDDTEVVVDVPVIPEVIVETVDMLTVLTEEELLLVLVPTPVPMPVPIPVPVPVPVPVLLDMVVETDIVELVEPPLLPLPLLPLLPLLIEEDIEVLELYDIELLMDVGTVYEEEYPFEVGAVYVLVILLE